MAQKKNVRSTFHLDQSVEPEHHFGRAKHPMEGRVRKDIRKWKAIVNQWSKEKELILKLTKVSLIGRSKPESAKLEKQAYELQNLFDREITVLNQVLMDSSMGSGIPVPNTTTLKREIERLAGVFRALKHDILEELVSNYPVTIV